VSRAGKVSGTVFGPLGDPVDGASIRLVNSGMDYRLTSTDGYGRFLITKLQDGLWDLFVASEGYVLSEPITFEIIRGNVTDFEIFLATGALVSGTVTDALGSPIEGVSVTICSDRNK